MSENSACSLGPSDCSMYSAFGSCCGVLLAFRCSICHTLKKLLFPPLILVYISVSGQLRNSCLHLLLVMLIEVRIFELRFINLNSNLVVRHSLFDCLPVISGVHLTSRIVRVGRRTEAHASQSRISKLHCRRCAIGRS